MVSELPPGHSYLTALFRRHGKRLGYTTACGFAASVAYSGIKVMGEPGLRYISDADISRLPRRKKNDSKKPHERKQPAEMPAGRTIPVGFAYNALGLGEKVKLMSLMNDRGMEVYGIGKRMSMRYEDYMTLANERGIAPVPLPDGYQIASDISSVDSSADGSQKVSGTLHTVQILKGDDGRAYLLMDIKNISSFIAVLPDIKQVIPPTGKQLPELPVPGLEHKPEKDEKSD